MSWIEPAWIFICLSCWNMCQWTFGQWTPADCTCCEWNFLNFFLCINFNVKNKIFTHKYLSGTRVQCFCMCICTNLLLNTEIKSYVYELSSNGANKSVPASVLSCTDKYCTLWSWGELNPSASVLALFKYCHKISRQWYLFQVESYRLIDFH